MKVLNVFVAAVALSFCPVLICQNQPKPLMTACGPLEASVAVSLDSSPHIPQQPQPGKALIYFIHDAGQDAGFTYPSTRIGMDGKWVGANKKSSWFSLTIEPGEHHLCAAIQYPFTATVVALAHLTAEAGKVYFYRTTYLSGTAYLGLQPIDSDEAAYQIGMFPMATAHGRK